MDGDEQRRRSAASTSAGKRRTVSASASGSSRRQSGKEGGSSSGSRSRRIEAAEHIAALLASASASCKKADIKGILVRPSAASDQPEMGSNRNGKSRGTSTSTEDNEAYHNNPVLAPLLKLLPKHVDPSTLKTLLKGVHPSAFGTFKTKETWRKENPDVLSNSFDSNSRAESCPAGCRGSSDDDDGTCSYSYSPTGSLSSLADLEEQAIYDDTPGTSVSPIPPLPSSSSSSVSPPRYTSAYLSTPQNLSLRRYRSNSSIASACTCTSASSRTSSIRFAPLPEEELQSRERKPQLSYAMGIAGRAKMLQGRKAPADLTEDSVDEIFDPELRQIDADFEEEEDLDRRSSDITLRYNEDGDIVEKRPLGVTLEELVFPVKKHRQQERGRSRATSDLSASFQRRSSSTEPPLSPSRTANHCPDKAQSPSSSSSSPVSRHASEDSSAYPTPMQTPRFADLSLEQTPIPTPRSTSPSIPHHSLSFTPISSPPKDASLTHQASSQAESAEEAEGDPSPELDPCDSSSPSGSSPESPSSDSSDFEDEDASSPANDDKSGEKIVNGDIPLPQLLMAQNQLKKMQNNTHTHNARKIKVSRPLSSTRSGALKKRA